MSLKKSGAFCHILSFRSYKTNFLKSGTIIDHQVLHAPFTGIQPLGLFVVRRLQDCLEALDEESGLLEDWREKYDILKSGMDAADEKIAQGKKAEGHEEIEGCYRMLKVRFNMSCLRADFDGAAFASN